MQFKDWAMSKKLTEHTSSYAEVSDLLRLADNRLNDCEKMQKSDISADTCFAIQALEEHALAPNLEAMGHKSGRSAAADKSSETAKSLKTFGGAART